MPLSLKNMRGCASPASTAICSSTTVTPRHRRLNSFLHDQHDAVSAPCISELPITPRSLYRKSSSSAMAGGDLTRRRSSAEIREYLSRRPRRSAEIRRSPPGSSRLLLNDTASFREDLPSMALVRTSPMLPIEDSREPVGPSDEQKKKKYGYGVVERRSDSVQSTPVYRLDSDRSGALIPRLPQVKPAYKESTFGAVVAVDRHRNPRLRFAERGEVKSPSEHQVVVLRVSLHCRGCVGKLRKHLSKMEGVTSFSIDLETKRVTVTGSVTPLDLLASISKVKNAQFWPSPATSADSLLSLSSSSSSSVLSRS